MDPELRENSAMNCREEIVLATVDLRGTQTQSGDQVLLNAYLQQLIGEPFLHCRFSYGNELMLHFGQPREPQSKKLKHLVVGSFILGARANRS